MGDQTSRKKLHDLEIESLRLPVERELCRALELDPEFRRIRGSIQRKDSRTIRRELQGFSLLLSRAMAPEVYEVAEEALALLGVEKDVEIFQASGRDSGGINAGIYAVEGEKLLILLEGRLLTNVNREGKLSILGHELGHHLAHGPGSPTRDTEVAARQIAFFGTGTHLDRIAGCLSMAMELTADRIGLLVCQDLDIVLRLGMVMAAGLPASELNWDPRAYLDQARALMEQTLTRGELALGDTHPEHNLRSYAAWLFSETEVYAALLGEGGVTRKLAQINTVLRKLLHPEVELLHAAYQTARGPFGAGPVLQRRVVGPTSRPASGPFTGKVGQPVTKNDPRPERSRELDGMLGDVSGAVSRASKKLKPGLSKLGKATTDGVSRVLGRKVPASSKDAAEEPEDFPDPLAEDEQDLLDRFADLERRMKDD